MERVTITIDDDLLKEVNSMVESGKAKNRSHAIDLLLKSAILQSSVKKAVILAAGKRERLWCEKFDTIKPLVEINGKAVIEKILEKLRNTGVRQVIIVVGYGGDQIIAKLKEGKEYGLEIEYISDENASGSAGALLLCREKITEPFILSYSDVYYPELDLMDLAKFHKENSSSSCTLALVNVKTPGSFGVAKLTGSKIVSFTEKPRSDAHSNLVNAGVAICEPSIFNYIAKVPCSFEKELLPELAQKEKLFAYVYSGKWSDVAVC